MRSKNANSTFMIPKSNNDVPLWFCQQLSRACRKGYWAVLREIVSMLTVLQHDSSREFVLVYLLAEASDAGNITLFKSLRSQYESSFSSIEEILVLYLKLGGSSVKRIADEEFPRAWERRKSEGRGSYLIKHLLKYVSQSPLMTLMFDTIFGGSLDDVALLLNSGNSTWLQVRFLTSTNKYSIYSQLLSILGELHPDEEVNPLSWAVLYLNYKIAEEFITTPFAKLGLSPLHCAVLVQSPGRKALFHEKCSFCR
ncbi:hypothetical protein B0J14DRAFT_149204 [Halenospora varia]|nr:hypothetical protein B0J14DRAFT_149204 [Halenospora varia]